MNATTIRLLVAAGVFSAIALGSVLVEAALTPGEIKMPARDFRDLPMKLGEWEGRESALDPEVQKLLAQEVIWVVNRNYRHPKLGEVAMHLALFKDAKDGTLHSPMDCYRGAGFTIDNARKIPVTLAGGRTLQASLSEWSNHGKKLLILYWFELGDDILYDRSDLMWAWWKLAGKKQWPPLIKVLVQTAETDEIDQDQRRITEFLAALSAWTEAKDSPTPPKKPS